MVKSRELDKTTLNFRYLFDIFLVAKTNV